ncbi:MAG: SixA phosphatase family protein [Gaiellales bacterium]
MLALLVRHAVAGDRRKWSGDDRLRPLDRRGKRQALALPEALSGFPVTRILTSPAARCIGTVGPLAAALGIEVEETPALAEGAERLDVISLAAAAGAGTVICTHGDVCHAVVGRKRMPKGSIWVIDIDGHDVTLVRHIAAAK